MYVRTYVGTYLVWKSINCDALFVQLLKYVRGYHSHDISNMISLGIGVYVVHDYLGYFI